MNDELAPTALNGGSDTTQRPTTEMLRMRNRLGGAYVEDGYHGDNLAIVLCTYFTDHLDRPENDEPTDDCESWGPWVIARCDAALDLLAKQLAEKP